MLIHGDAANRVVCARSDRDEIAREIEAKTGAEFANAGETLPHHVGIEMSQVEIDVGMLGALHAAHDRQGTPRRAAPVRHADLRPA